MKSISIFVDLIVAQRATFAAAAAISFQNTKVTALGGLAQVPSALAMPRLRA